MAGARILCGLVGLLVFVCLRLAFAIENGAAKVNMSKKLPPDKLTFDEPHEFCQLEGNVAECTCGVDVVDYYNNYKIEPLLARLLQTDFFRYAKVNLARPCPFWHDDSICALKDCSVESCTDEDIPIGLKGEASQVADMAKKYSQKMQEKENCEEEPSNEELGALNATISMEKFEQLQSWKKHDDTMANFCELDDETSCDMQYVDLLLNPERFTGYKGDSAHRVWHSIYSENCFKPAKSASYDFLNSETITGMCLEKRAFFRAISGLHASINIHLCAMHFFPGKNFGKGRWDYNLAEFQRRFSPETTDGEGPQWLKNLYFLYLLEMRALIKAAPYFDDYDFYTGSDKDDDVKEIVSSFLKTIETFPEPFDESMMFQGNQRRAFKLRESFRAHFFNISRIMDCVGCDKCKLWGKIQVQGLGTALKILFSHSGEQVGAGSVVDAKSKHNFQLRRAEILSLFNAFGRLSRSLKELDTFRKMLKEKS